MAARKRAPKAQPDVRAQANAAMAEVNAKLGEAFSRIAPLSAVLAGRGIEPPRKTSLADAQLIPGQLRQRAAEMAALERLLTFLAFLFQEIRRAPAQPVRKRRSRAAAATPAKRSARHR
jgi:uncharacterized small protein (DUF1192 family)